jgi:hypothetical protein
LLKRIGRARARSGVVSLDAIFVSALRVRIPGLPRAGRASLPFELAPKRLDGLVCGTVSCYPGRYRTAHETNIPF